MRTDIMRAKIGIFGDILSFFMAFSPKSFLFMYLCPQEFWCHFSDATERVVKRESGENPEQTRCCKLRRSFPAILKSTVSAIKRREGRQENGVSQKTCQNENLDTSGSKVREKT